MEDNDTVNSNQILITGISWKKTTIHQYRSKKDIIEELPTQYVIDVPQNVLNQANKKTNNFNDVIESFVYNFLTRKFNHEVYHCQIWLSLSM